MKASLARPMLLDRRTLARAGCATLAQAFAASIIGSLGRPGVARAAGSLAAPKAHACIWIWLNGGPSHVDTFDPKPGASGGGPFKAIKTRASGVEICEHMPKLAERSDLAIVRSMSSREGNHDRAKHLLHTGYSPSPTVAHPSLGAWVAEEIDHRDLDLPAFVAIGGPSADSGFLGAEHAPFIVKNASKPPDNVALPPGVDEARFERRQKLLTDLESSFAKGTGDPKVSAREAVYTSATKLMGSPHLSAFDLSSESAATKERYGDTDFGKGCLIGKRLVDVGVRFVEVTLDGWDTHKDNFGRTKSLMGVLDSGASALLHDLSERGTLGSTLVVIAGEFGRTPKINLNDGRDHHPQAWSVVLVGGGIRGGQAYGKTDADGEAVVDKPVKVPDLLATIATLLGVDPDRTLDTPSGRPISITDQGKPIRELMLG